GEGARFPALGSFARRTFADEMPRILPLPEGEGAAGAALGHIERFICQPARATIHPLHEPPLRGGRDAFHRVPISTKDRGRGGTRPYRVHGRNARNFSGNSLPHPDTSGLRSEGRAFAAPEWLRPRRRGEGERNVRPIEPPATDCIPTRAVARGPVICILHSRGHWICGCWTCARPVSQSMLTTLKAFVVLPGGDSRTFMLPVGTPLPSCWKRTAPLVRGISSSLPLMSWPR